MRGAYASQVRAPRCPDSAALLDLKPREPALSATSCVTDCTFAGCFDPLRLRTIREGFLAWREFVGWPEWKRRLVSQSGKASPHPVTHPLGFISPLERCLTSAIYDEEAMTL